MQVINGVYVQIHRLSAGPTQSFRSMKMVTPTSYHFHASKLCVLAQWSKKIYLRLRLSVDFDPDLVDVVVFATEEAWDDVDTAGVVIGGMVCTVCVER